MPKCARAHTHTNTRYSPMLLNHTLLINLGYHKGATVRKNVTLTHWSWFCGHVILLASQSCRRVIVLLGGTNFMTSYCSTVGTFDQNRPRTLTIAECLQHRKHKGLFTCMGLTVTSKKKKKTRSRKSWSKLWLNPPHDTEKHFIKGSILLEWVDLNSQIKKPSLQVIIYIYIYLYI